jgi:hypothetical protein
MQRVGLGALAVVLGLNVACSEEQPCDRYVDYMCACHDGEQGFDCAELAETYSKASAEVQNECALELRDQRDEDDEEGLECDA